MQEKKNPKKEFVDIARLTSVGIALVLCTLIGYWIGNYVDRALHTAPIFLIVFFLLGVGAGIINVFRTISKTDD
jgi:F0F1-type ATP synthase assembly protein I